MRGFSGGERQLLGIAQACIHDPDLLVLDPMGRRDEIAREPWVWSVDASAKNGATT